jgi:Uma2 family endonuclease
MKPEMKRERHEATYEDLCALPPHVLGQIIDGELVALPRPANEHTIVASTLGMDLGSAFQRGRGGPGGWWILDEPELHLGRDVLVPDLAGWRHSRLPTIPREPFFTLVPDWICEVLSPSTAAMDRIRKKRIYAREGVQYIWLVDPAAQTLEVYRLHEGHWLELGSWSGNERVRAEPFEALELELESLWPAVTPEP